MDSLLHQDTYLILADFLSYVHCQRSVEAAYHDQSGWTRRAILNVANMGVFSSDRTILSYARDIWGVYVPPPGAPRCAESFLRNTRFYPVSGFVTCALTFSSSSKPAGSSPP